MGRVRRGQWREPARIVLPIGKQNHELALGLRVLQAASRGSQGRANGRTILNHPNLSPVQILQQPAMIKGEWTLGIGAGAEQDQPNPIPASDGHKIPDDRLHHLQPVGSTVIQTKVFGQHAARNVNGQHNIDPFSVILTLGFAELWAGKSEDEEKEGDPPTHRQNPTPVAFPRMRQGMQDSQARIADRRLVGTPPLEPEDQRDEQPDQQHPGVMQPHVDPPVAGCTRRQASERAPVVFRPQSVWLLHRRHRSRPGWVDAGRI